jgi:hypothetical protein
VGVWEGVAVLGAHGFSLAVEPDAGVDGQALAGECLEADLQIRESNEKMNDVEWSGGRDEVEK